MNITRFTQSEIRCFSACRQRWLWQYEKLYTKSDGEHGVRRCLDVGKAVHFGVELLLQGKPVETAVSGAVTRGDPQHAETIAEMVKSYAEWAEDNPLPGKVVATEVPFEVYVTPQVTVAGVIDGVLENEDGTLSILEHKTTAALCDSYFRKLATDFQVRLYAYAVRVDGRFGGKPVKSVFYTAISSVPPNTPKILKDGKVSTKIGVKTTLKRYLAALEEAGQSPDDPMYAEVLEKLRTGAGFVMRREYLFDNKDMLRFVNELRHVVREMRSSPLIYRNTGDCESFGGCPFIPVCEGTASIHSPPYYRRKYRHQELAGVDFSSVLGYSTSPLSEASSVDESDELFSILGDATY